jgi:8-oxo-dGTP diphosphatase
MDFHGVFKLARVVACDPVVIRDGKVLMVKRRDGPHEKFAGWWCLPGGIMQLGETCEAAALRELYEETGFRGRIKKFVGVYSEPKRDNRQTVAVAFIVSIIGGTARTSDETSEVKFFPLNRLPAKVAFDHRKVIGDAGRLLKP